MLTQCKFKFPEGFKNASSTFGLISFSVFSTARRGFKICILYEIVATDLFFSFHNPQIRNHNRRSCLENKTKCWIFGTYRKSIGVQLYSFQNSSVKTWTKNNYGVVALQLKNNKKRTWPFQRSRSTKWSCLIGLVKIFKCIHSFFHMLTICLKLSSDKNTHK